MNATNSCRKKKLKESTSSPTINRYELVLLGDRSVLRRTRETDEVISCWRQKKGIKRREEKIMCGIK
jgi:hypothetical protein